MDAVTYPNDNVAETIHQYTVPLRVAHDKPLKEIPKDLEWTPYLYVVDYKGTILLKSVGFLPAEELVPWILLGCGRMRFEKKEWNMSANIMNIIFSNYPDSHCAPQALYLNTIARFHLTHEPSILKQGYDDIKKYYPRSIWTKKTLPYRLL